jgi:hypothetical protein
MGILPIPYPAIVALVAACRHRGLMQPLPRLRPPIPMLEVVNIRAALPRLIPLSSSADPTLRVANPSAAGIPATDGKGYVPTKYYAETLEDLAIKLGEHGPAAVSATRWSSVIVWMMKMPWPRDGILSNPYPLASKAVSLVQRHEMASLGYPHHAGEEFVSPMDDLPAFAWQGIMSAALETMTDWEQAGYPYLTLDRIKSTQQYVQSCVYHARKRREAAATVENGQEGTVESFAGISGSHLSPDRPLSPQRPSAALSGLLGPRPLAAF